MTIDTTFTTDVMQVCRNGHVVTEQLHVCPEQSRYHCEVCSAPTISTCPTCGHEIPGAVVVPGVTLVGMRRAPDSCSVCGASFPWAEGTDTANAITPRCEETAGLESLLRRLPHTIRQLRNRRPDRPAFRVNDHYDLEELIRALLPLVCDEIRSNSRTPSYSLYTLTDFVLPKDKAVLTVKTAVGELWLRGLEAQVQEDTAAYRRETWCKTLWVYVFDPLGQIREPRDVERLCSSSRIRCIISG